ncbi:MAG: hypothetical protein JWM07_160 [Candidatus Saccharibacteria bacterium]|jgi:hypothetical protein|nr:hypothetical protein [Candidatus Saccharibacteria bacterium]
MGIAENRTVSELDAGLKVLKAFIEESGIGQQTVDRELVTDTEYEFTIYTTLPKLRNQRQAEMEKYVVKIAAGSKLYFLTRTDAGRVKSSDFIVKDGDIAWKIDTYAKSVRRLRHNIGAKVIRPLPKSKTQE